MNILDHEAAVNSAFLHPGGVQASRFLPSLLEAKSGHLILEIGCGTGATLAFMAKTAGAYIVGLDRSAVMLKSAQKRIRHNRIDPQVRLVLANGEKNLPFSNEEFDGICAESALVFLTTEKILAECHRLLRPGGMLVFNERVWKPNVDAALSKSINDRSKSRFGIPAATMKPLSCEDWCDFLAVAGFHQIAAVPVDTLLSNPGRPRADIKKRLRRLILRLRHPVSLKESLRYRFAIRQTKDINLYLESYVFSARKPARIG